MINTIKSLGVHVAVCSVTTWAASLHLTTVSLMSGQETQWRCSAAHSSTQTFKRDMLQERLALTPLRAAPWRGPGVEFFSFLNTKCPFSFQEIMNRCISAKGKKEVMDLLVPAEQRDLSRCRPHQTQESWAETCKMLFLFNRCHIIFKTPETDSQELFFPFLRLQISAVCVLSLFYKGAVRWTCLLFNMTHLSVSESLAT